MRRFLKTLIIISCLIISTPMNVKAKSSIDINELVEHAKKMDGKEIAVQGEAIGESMNRGDYSWININDGTNAIGIWLEKDDANKVKYYGNYKFIGDTVKISGIFYRACKEHGGEADIHCNSIEIIKVGHQVKEQISIKKIIVLAILAPVASLMLVFFVKRLKIKTNEKYRI